MNGSPRGNGRRPAEPAAMAPGQGVAAAGRLALDGDWRRSPTIAAAGRPRGPGRRLRARALDALVKSVLCCASAHVLVLVADALLRRETGGLNVFTMLEAQRLWPALARAGATQWWSLALGVAVWGAWFAASSRRARPARDVAGAIPHRRVAPAPRTAPAAAPRTNGTAPVATRDGAVVRLAAPGAAPLRVSVAAGLLALVAGLGAHMLALAAIERLVPAFPPVPDVVHERLPYVEFGPPGELAYAAFLVAVAWVLFRTQPRTVPAILALLGAFYALRGCFLFLLPIGIPPTAPPLEERFVLWPFAGHAYFPGGHTGMMTVLGLSVGSRRWRRVFLAVAFAFAIGTLLARTHYAADALGGWLAGYAVVLWGRRHLDLRAGGPVSPRAAARPAPRHEHECEA